MQWESRLCKFCPELIIYRYHLREKHRNSHPALDPLFHLSQFITYQQLRPPTYEQYRQKPSVSESVWCNTDSNLELLSQVGGYTI